MNWLFSLSVSKQHLVICVCGGQSHLDGGQSHLDDIQVLSFGRTHGK